MAVAREEKAQHGGRSTQHQKQDAAKEAAATTSMLGKRRTVLIVAALVAAVRFNLCAIGREAGIVAARASRANGNGGRFQVEARECAGRGRGKGLRNQCAAFLGCRAAPKGPAKRRVWSGASWHPFRKTARNKNGPVSCGRWCAHACRFSETLSGIQPLVFARMDFYALGLGTPLATISGIPTDALHDPLTCSKDCCCESTKVPRTVVTPAGTRVRPPPLRSVPLLPIAHSIPADAAAFYADPLDSPQTDIYADGIEDMDASFAAAIASEEACSVAYEERERITRLCVLAVHSTGGSQSDCVLQAVVKGFGDGGVPTVCYDVLWRIPSSCKISVKSFKTHGIHYRDLRASGEPPSREILTLMQLLLRLTKGGARLVIHNAKTTVRLLKQTAAQTGHGSVWTFPFLPTCMTAPSRRILNLPDRANPKALAVPTERDVYRYLYKKPYDEEEPDASCISELARTCTVTRDNFVAGVGRGWWS